MESSQIPGPVVAVVAEVLAEHLTHTNIDSTFMEAGAPGEVGGMVNKVKKCMTLLKRSNHDANVDAFQVLGRVLEDFMEVYPRGIQPGCRDGDRQRIREALAEHGLSYHVGGKILGGSIGAPTRSLESALKSRDLRAVEEEFNRCVENVEADPAAALTAACAGLESLLKHYIHDENLEMPGERSIGPLWKVVRADLGLSSDIVGDDQRQMLGGLASVIGGLGAFRTHAGSAHGGGRDRAPVKPRHARLAIHAAHTVAVFLIEEWNARKG